jgi:hypothetical protein
LKSHLFDCLKHFVEAFGSFSLEAIMFKAAEATNFICSIHASKVEDHSPPAALHCYWISHMAGNP